jgi:hypothetical protein
VIENIVSKQLSRAQKERLVQACKLYLIECKKIEVASEVEEAAKLTRMMIQAREIHLLFE